jgi:copper(I)-binding protein
MKKLLILLLALLPGLSALAGDIEIKDAWVRAVPPSMDGTAAFFTILNHGAKPVRLVGGATSFARTVEPMVTTRRTEGGREVMGMKAVDFLEVPAGGEATLEPGGDHLMLMGLSEHPKRGETVTVTLRFSPGEKEMKVVATVR